MKRLIRSNPVKDHTPSIQGTNPDDSYLERFLCVQRNGLYLTGMEQSMTFDTTLISAKSDNAPSGYSEGQVSYVLQFSRELLSQDDSKSTVGLHSQSEPFLDENDTIAFNVLQRS